MKKILLFTLLLFTLLFISSCGESSSHTVSDANLSSEQPPMFPNWNGEVPK